MKNTICKLGLGFAAMGLLLGGCAGKKEAANEEETTEAAVTTAVEISLTNPLGIDRIDEPVVLSKFEVDALGGSAAEGKLPVISLNGEPLPSQCDDLDGDGTYDEFVFACSFTANEAVKATLDFVEAGAYPSFEAKTKAALLMSPNRDKSGYAPVMKETRPIIEDPTTTVQSYQMEGPAVENDKIAFRSYFDFRNGKDIFGKITDKISMDSIGTSGNYHDMQYWGMDILKVGNSLGAGAIGVYDTDDIVRLGETESTTYEFVTEGPVRAAFNLVYKGWDVNGQKLDVTHRLNIFAGKYGYRSDVILSSFEGEKELVTGIVNMKLKEKVLLEKDSEGFVVMGTHGIQSEKHEKDNLGMAILVPKSTFIEKGEAPAKAAKEGGVENTYYARIKAEADNASSYYFFAGWETSDAQFADAEYFMSMVKTEADKLSAPIQVSK